MNLPQLTATRFFAAFGIVIYHFGVLVPSVAPFDIPWVHDLFSYSCLGVSYFFVLSGFIMAVVYYQPTRTLDRRRYWVARFARIYPLYALGLVLALIYPLLPLGESFQALTHTGSARASLRMVYEHITSHDPTAVALNFSLLQAWVHGYSMTINPPGWSLSIEALFYLSFPLVLHVAYRLGIRALVAVALGIWVFSLVFQMALIRPGDYWLQFPLMNFNVFIFGFTTGVLFLKTAQRGAAQRGAARQELADARRWQWALGVLALSCIGLVVLVPGLQAYLGAFMNPV
ncbi:MAG: acyltransferase, partial [Cytophagaceae bacterium]|nr:acyltransferase [Cytophagaceae bacterium]